MRVAVNHKDAGSSPAWGDCSVEYRQVERLSFLVRAFKGSNPFTPKKEMRVCSSVGRAVGF
jgi:hypothetical protein